MTKIKQEDLPKLTAEARGWVVRKKDIDDKMVVVRYYEKDGTPTNYWRSHVGGPAQQALIWQPHRDLNQSRELLEEFTEKNGGHASLVINDAGMQTTCQRCFIHMDYDCILIAQACHETSLAVAICLAYLEATTETKYELEVSDGTDQVG